MTEICSLLEMRLHFLIPLFVFLFYSCSPVSYINHSPSSSMLEQQGDAYINSGFGIDMNSINVKAGLAWSPIERYGIEAEYTGKIKGRYDQVSNGSGSLVYYIPLKNRSSFEFQAGYGWGKLRGHDNLAREDGTTIRNPDRNPLPYLFAQVLDDGFALEAKHTTLKMQANYNFHQSEKDRRITVGLGSRVIRFSDYLYKTKGDSLYGSFNAVTLDPFVELNQNIGRVIFNARVSHTFLPQAQKTEKRVHPHFSKAIFSFGFQFKINDN